MARRPQRFLGLSTGSLPSNFVPRMPSYRFESPPRRSSVHKRSRQGLSGKEQELIGKYLSFYLSLHRGERRPTTQAQRHFIAVCRGRTKPATEHEWAFVKWRGRRRSC
jgi:hypothetical protein